MAYYAASIDDNDPAFIYSDGWQLVTQDLDWRGTMHSTSDKPGVNARVRFTGSRVAAVFTIPTGDGNIISASFSIDGRPGVIRSRATTPPVQWNYLLFDSGPLPYGNHILVITNTSPTGYLRLDRIDYDPTPNSAPTSSAPADKTTTVQAPPKTVVITTGLSNSNTPVVSSTPSPSPSHTESSSRPASSSQGTGQSSHTNSDSTLNPNSTPTDRAASSIPTSLPGATPTSALDANTNSNTASTASKSSGPSAALIGGVLGAVVVILLLILAAILILRRKRKLARRRTNAGDSSMPYSDTPANTVPTPFDVNMRNISSTHLVPTSPGYHPGHSVSPSGSGTDYSSPTSDMYTNGPGSSTMSSSAYRPNVAFDPTMMASSKHAEYLQEVANAQGHGQGLGHDQSHPQFATMSSPGASSGYASYNTNPQRLSAFADYAPPPAYQ